MTNPSFSINTIMECISDLGEPIEDKHKYFDQMVVERLNKCHSLYMKDFDAQLKKIVDYADSDKCDIIAMGNMIKKLSKLANSLYKTEISLYKSLL